MSQISDLTFITNEIGNKLGDRFKKLIKDTKFFDVLVGYFYTSGFWQIYPEIESSEKIRILIGISTNREVHDHIQTALKLSSHELKEHLSAAVQIEIDTARESEEIERWIRVFVDWLKSGKLEIKAYPTEKIHAKIYIMTFEESDRDVGRVITGSSNFTQSGLSDNLEFNVELKNPADYHYAKTKFEELWIQAVDVSEKYIETIEQKTWIKKDITPYFLYLKFLYEYFEKELSQPDTLDLLDRPAGFKEFRYQTDAVINAARIVEEYGGVFISDVVGLGKTFMGTMLAQYLGGKVLVIAPPRLLDRENSGGWIRSFENFGFRMNQCHFESTGSLEKVLERSDLESFETVIIDEAHHFRNEGNETYAKVQEICSGKRVILITATPYNNRPSDLLAQIKLFQRSKASTIPGIRDLEVFFAKLESKLKPLDRLKDKEEYLWVTRENSRQIREHILKYLMVRRTRNEIKTYYERDLQEQGVRFPEIANPSAIYYAFNPEESQIFDQTVEIISKRFKYSRYAPLIHYHGWKNEQEKTMQIQGQKNMIGFMRMLLVKRLESSFYAFRKTVDRFIRSYEGFIKLYDAGNVYVSPKNAPKILEAFEGEDFDAIEILLQSGKADRYETWDFWLELRVNIDADLELLKQIQKMWAQIERDPKLETFQRLLDTDPVLAENHLIIFTESKETAEYLNEQLSKKFPTKVLLFAGSSGEADRKKVLENFDNKSNKKSNEFRILITTDVLAEWVNLHRSNVVINYDIPWNPTRIMQRVGRINRVDTPHSKIYTYTCFPTDEGNNQIKLRESAVSKIEAFITLLGSDSRLLTEDESIEWHTLFDKILSKEAIAGEDQEWESELKYLEIITHIRDKNPELFSVIKNLPKKSRSVMVRGMDNSVVSYYRKGNVEKFCTTGSDGSYELDFFETAHLLECMPETQKAHGNTEFYRLKERNDDFFEGITSSEESPVKKGGAWNSEYLLKILNSPQIKTFGGFTDLDEHYLMQVRTHIESGALAKNTASKLKENISKNTEILVNPLKLIFTLRQHISGRLLQVSAKQNTGKKDQSEVILSLYLVKE